MPGQSGIPTNETAINRQGRILSYLPLQEPTCAAVRKAMARWVLAKTTPVSFEPHTQREVDETDDERAVS